MDKETKNEIKRLKGKIFRGTSSEEEENRYHELSGIHPSIMVRETLEQKNIRNEKDRIRGKLRRNQTLRYSYMYYPVDHPHAGMPYQQDMTDAEYHNLYHRFEVLFKKTNSSNHFRCRPETDEQEQKRLDKDRDHKRKVRGVWNSENDFCPGKGTETAEQREVRLAKERSRARERYKNLSQQQKKALSRIKHLRRKANGFESFNGEECDELYSRITYERERVNRSKEGAIKYNEGMLRKSGYKFLDSKAREKQRILKEISEEIERANSDLYKREMSPDSNNYFREGPPTCTSNRLQDLRNWLTGAEAINRQTRMRIWKYKELQDWVYIFKKQKHLLSPETQKELMEHLSWAVRVDIPDTNLQSMFYHVKGFRMRAGLPVQYYDRNGFPT
jgi:hypothetical protein